MDVSLFTVYWSKIGSLFQKQDVVPSWQIYLKEHNSKENIYFEDNLLDELNKAQFDSDNQLSLSFTLKNVFT